MIQVYLTAGEGDKALFLNTPKKVFVHGSSFIGMVYKIHEFFVNWLTQQILPSRIFLGEEGEGARQGSW